MINIYEAMLIAKLENAELRRKAQQERRSK